MTQVEAAQDGKEGHARREDAADMMSCNKVWFVQSFLSSQVDTDTGRRDRLQSMEKFRNGEIDMDSLCADLKSKARCSEGGAAIHQKDLDHILSSTR